MNVLIDTNILGRLTEPNHPHHRLALEAAAALRQRGDILCVVPQILYEFWVVATRPTAANGLGLSTAEAVAELAKVKILFAFLPDTAAVYPEWERLVSHHQVSGKNAHDARLAAAMVVHGLTHTLTFNTGDFARFRGLTALAPLALAVSSPPTP